MCSEEAVHVFLFAGAEVCLHLWMFEREQRCMHVSYYSFLFYSVL